MTLGSTGPLEAKTKAATGGSAAGVALAGLVLWLLDTYAFTTTAVPDPLVAAVVTLLPVGLTFAGGFFARHTPRNDPDAQDSEVTALADRDARRRDPPDGDEPRGQHRL